MGVVVVERQETSLMFCNALNSKLQHFTLHHYKQPVGVLLRAVMGVMLCCGYGNTA